MTERAVEEVGRLLSRRVGLRLDPAIRGRLARAVRDEAERLGEDQATYGQRLESDPERLQDLLNRVTVQETSFFRDQGQFEALVAHVLPALREEGRRVDIWSAGCANGQEPYSLAMVLAESGIADWHVIASDLSTDAVARTRAARYRERELRGISPERRARHLVRVAAGDEWEIAAQLRDRVTTVRHNLAAEPPPFAVGRCHVVFCRNVLIYFGHDDLIAFLHRLATYLPASAHLFLGYSESLWQVTDRFHLVRLGDAFAYRPSLPDGRAATHRAPTSGPAVPRRATPPTPATPANAPVPKGAGRAAAAPPAPQPTAVVLMAEGEAALGRGDHAGAVTAFRKAAFIDPDHPIAHLNLGVALEVMGDAAAARRAYAAARAALARCDSAEVESTLEGYRLEDLISLLEGKIGP